MYQAFYGFSRRPFMLSPDPDLYFNSLECQRAQAYFDYGLQQQEGLILITGDTGTGKTSLLKTALAAINSPAIIIGQINAPHIGADDLVRLIAGAFGLRITGLAKAELLLALEARLLETVIDQKRSILVIDDAHNLTPEALRDLAVIAALQLGQQALLQIILVGDSSLRETLQASENQALQQRIISAAHLAPLSLSDLQAYIEHRIGRCTEAFPGTLASESFAALRQASGGIPRQLNRLMDRLLLAGMLADDKHFTAQNVAAVAAELAGELGLPPGAPGLACPAPSADIDRLTRRLQAVEAQLAALQDRIDQLPEHSLSAPTTETH